MFSSVLRCLRPRLLRETEAFALRFYVAFYYVDMYTYAVCAAYAIHYRTTENMQMFIEAVAVVDIY